MHLLSVLPRHLASFLLISSLLAGGWAHAASDVQATPGLDTEVLDLAKSSIRATFSRGKPRFTAVFRHFSSDIRFDPSRLGAAHATFTIEVASIDLGQTALNQAARSRDWLDVEQFPDATFVSDAIVSAGGGKYSVLGKLTLRGKTRNVVLPISYTQTATGSVFEGVLPIRRLQFGVGQGADAEPLGIADGVIIRFHIVTRLPPSNTDNSDNAGHESETH